MGKDNILDLLSKRPVIGDGSYVWILEKRGYVRADSWTPECVIDHPEAGISNSLTLSVLYARYTCTLLLHPRN